MEPWSVASVADDEFVALIADLTAIRGASYRRRSMGGDHNQVEYRPREADAPEIRAVVGQVLVRGATD